LQPSPAIAATCHLRCSSRVRSRGERHRADRQIQDEWQRLGLEGRQSRGPFTINTWFNVIHTGNGQGGWMQTTAWATAESCNNLRGLLNVQLTVDLTGLCCWLNASSSLSLSKYQHTVHVLHHTDPSTAYALQGRCASCPMLHCCHGCPAGNLNNAAIAGQI
jgi:hypothetical protein